MLKMLHTSAKEDSYEGHYKDYDNSTDNNNYIVNTNDSMHIYLPAKEDGYEGHDNEAAIGNDHFLLGHRHLVILIKRPYLECLKVKS